MTDLKAKIEALPKRYDERDAGEHYPMLSLSSVLALIATHAAEPEPEPVAVEGMPDRIWASFNAGGSIVLTRLNKSEAKSDTWHSMSGPHEYIRADLAPTGNTDIRKRIEALADEMWRVHPNELDAAGYIHTSHGGKYENPRAAWYADKIEELMKDAGPFEACPSCGGTGRYGDAAARSIAGMIPVAPSGNTALVEAENAQLRNAVNDACRALGAPGDWGYSTREGKAVLALHQVRAALSQPAAPQTVECPCVSVDHDDDCPEGYPSALCGICDGTGNTTPEKVTALAVEMLRIAHDLGESEDPFAAWESAAPQPTPQVEALRPFAQMVAKSTWEITV